MTKVIVDIDEDLNKRFRDTILERKGWNKGVIRDAMIEAIECWIKINQKSKTNDDEDIHEKLEESE